MLPARLGGFLGGELQVFLSNANPEASERNMSVIRFIESHNCGMCHPRQLLGKIILWDTGNECNCKDVINAAGILNQSVWLLCCCKLLFIPLAPCENQLCDMDFLPPGSYIIETGTYR